MSEMTFNQYALVQNVAQLNAKTRSNEISVREHGQQTSRSKVRSSGSMSGSRFLGNLEIICKNKNRIDDFFLTQKIFF